MNNSINIKTLDPDLPVAVMGKTGEDEDGDLIREALTALDINIDHISAVPGIATSYTDVYTETVGGARTFFHFRGPNAEWGYDDIDFDALGSYRIVHIGYILLLDTMDAEDDEYGTCLARTLSRFKDMGVKTAVDVVTDLSGSFKETVTPALNYTDYLVLNEMEAGETAGVRVRDDNEELIKEGIAETGEKLMHLGENTEVVVIHMPEGAYGLTREGESMWIDSLTIPEQEIKSTVGAGDAFCTGMLYALHEAKTLEEAIRLGHGMAAQCLYSPTCTGGATSLKELLEFIENKSQ
jgi:sugar/nucleoside kinase (ribokinase family)